MLSSVLRRTGCLLITEIQGWERKECIGEGNKNEGLLVKRRERRPRKKGMVVLVCPALYALTKRSMGKSRQSQRGMRRGDEIQESTWR